MDPEVAVLHDRTGDEDAVDDSGDIDPEVAKIKTTLSQKRYADKESSAGDPQVQKLLPFPFAPNIRPLTISDVESCVALECAAFPQPEHRATPEKFEYRLATCPELCLGLFCTVVPDHAAGFEIETLATARAVETDRPDGALSVLLAHIVSTRSCAQVVTDDDMALPPGWKTAGKGAGSGQGHQEYGRTVVLHSLAVSPKLQGCGLGKLLMKAYLQQMNNSGLADRVALICQDYLVSYYERFGYKHMGESKARFGGDCWHDMVFDLAGPPKVPQSD